MQQERTSTLTILQNRAKLISGSTLKIIAMLAMLIDHFGAVLVYGCFYRGIFFFGLDAEGSILLYKTCRFIGRSSFPLYAFLLVEGFLHTHSKLRYSLRLFLFAVISEIPYDLALNSDAMPDSLNLLAIFEANRADFLSGNNVFFTLSAGLVTLWACDALYHRLYDVLHCDSPVSDKAMTLRFISCLIPLTAGFVLGYLLKGDYKGWGVALFVLLYFLHAYPLPAAGLGYGLIASAMENEYKTFPGFILTLFYNGKRGITGKGFKWFCYLFYPVHLSVLVLIRVWMLR